MIDSGQAHVYGHCSVLFEKGNSEAGVFVVGGFGCDEKGAHKRNKHAFNLVPKDCFTSYTIEQKYFCSKKISLEAMHATLNLYRCSDTTHHSMILYGGRTSPNKCVNMYPSLIEIDSKGHLKCQPLVSDSSKVSPRWRHSSVIAKQHGNDMFIVFNGCTKNSEVQYN